jgi:hypothetical protein
VITNILSTVYRVLTREEPTFDSAEVGSNTFTRFFENITESGVEQGTIQHQLETAQGVIQEVGDEATLVHAERPARQGESNSIGIEVAAQDVEGGGQPQVVGLPPPSAGMPDINMEEEL